jgi:hypothetical protein
MMGGFGSGRPSGVGRTTVDACRSIDVNRLQREGCLRPGYSGGWQWTRDGQRVASIQMRRDRDHVVLSYQTQQHGEEWQDIEQSTSIVWMPCHFGGARPYFVCPGIVNGIVCSRRVVKLYGAGMYFLCRHCYRLAYASQREDRYDRALRRANNIPFGLAGSPVLRRRSLRGLRACTARLTSAFNPLY